MAERLHGVAPTRVSGHPARVPLLIFCLEGLHQHPVVWVWRVGQPSPHQWPVQIDLPVEALAALNALTLSMTSSMTPPSPGQRTGPRTRHQLNLPSGSLTTRAWELEASAQRTSLLCYHVIASQRSVPDLGAMRQARCRLCASRNMTALHKSAWRVQPFMAHRALAWRTGGKRPARSNIGAAAKHRLLRAALSVSTSNEEEDAA